MQRKLEYPYQVDMEYSGNDGTFKWYIVDCRTMKPVMGFYCFEDMEEALQDEKIKRDWIGVKDE